MSKKGITQAEWDEKLDDGALESRLREKYYIKSKRTRKSVSVLIGRNLKQKRFVASPVRQPDKVHISDEIERLERRLKELKALVK